jgi:hypothetical protein
MNCARTSTSVHDRAAFAVNPPHDNAPLKMRFRCSCHVGVNPLISDGDERFRGAYWRGGILFDPQGPCVVTIFERFRP